MKPGNGTRNGTGVGKKKTKIRRGIAKREDMMVAAVLKTFRHLGVDSYRPQGEVAREMGISPEAVVALLQAAFKGGIARILINVPEERAEVARLQEDVRRRFDLKRVLLVAGDQEILGASGERRRRLHTQVIRAMAQRAAEYLDELVAAAAVRQHAAQAAAQKFDPFVVGVSWGRSMNTLSQYLRSTPRPRAPDVRVYPIVGVTSALKVEPVEANMVAMSFGQAYRGGWGQLASPAFLAADQAEMALKFAPVARSLAKVRRADVIITSMGPICGSLDASEITLTNDQKLNAQLLEDARAAGAIGEVCYWLFDAEGREVKTQFQGIGLGFDGLREIAQDPECDVVLMCGGDRLRFEPLRVALEKAKLASVLVSDTITARYLVGELDSTVLGHRPTDGRGLRS